MTRAADTQSLPPVALVYDVRALKKLAEYPTFKIHDGKVFTMFVSPERSSTSEVMKRLLTAVRNARQRKTSLSIETDKDVPIGFVHQSGRLVVYGLPSRFAAPPKPAEVADA